MPPGSGSLDERDELRRLAEAATPGPWEPLTHGTASQRDAAGRVFLAVMAVRAPDNPDIEYTDLSWVETTPDGPHIALTGNGPNAPENSKFIAAANPAVVLALLRELDRLEVIETAAQEMFRRAGPICPDCGVVGLHPPATGQDDCAALPLRIALIPSKESPDA